MKDIKIGRKWVGKNHPTYLIAEIGSNFDGSMERAKKLIDDAIACGASAVKFQSFKTDKIVSKEGFEGMKVGFQSKWDKPVVDVYKKAEFPREWHKEIMDYCESKNIDFFSAPYDFEAVDLLDEMGVAAFKIGSGDLNWHEIIEHIAKKGKPVILATGASTFDEVKASVDIIKKHTDQLILLQCTTNYPTKFESSHVNAMKNMGETFDVLYGISDHTPGSMVPVISVALGGVMIEKHFTDDRSRDGPDHPFAIDLPDFKEMREKVDLTKIILGSPVKELYEEEKETVILQRRSLRASKDLSAGTIITRDMVEVLRPAPLDAMMPPQITELVGSKLKVDLKKGENFKIRLIE